MTTRMPHLLPALLAVILLAGCAPTPAAPPGASPTGGPSASPSPSVSPSPAPAPAVADPDILFTITATATSPSGAVAHLRQVVYAPISEAELPAADIAQLGAECDGWRPLMTGPSYVVSLIDVTDESPAGAVWDSGVAVVDLTGSPVFTGQITPFQAYCSSVQVGLGASRGVTPVEGGDWETVDYGFAIAVEAGYDVPSEYDTLLSDCAIELGVDASSSAIASAWVGLAHGPLECLFR